MARVTTKYADGRTKDEIRKGGKVVKRVQPNKGTIAVDYSEEPVVAYCMKCKEKREVKDPKQVAISGKSAIRGLCSVCGTKVFRFIKAGTAAKTAKKAPVKSKPKAKTSKEPSKLSAKAKAAYAKLKKAGKLGDCWCGQTKSGKAIWWEGDAEKGWTICHDPIPDTEMGEFKRLVVKSL